MRRRTAAPAAPESVSARPRKVRTYDERVESGDRVAAHGAFKGVLSTAQEDRNRKARGSLSPNTTQRWPRRFHPCPDAPVQLLRLPHAGGSASFCFPFSRALSGSAEVVCVVFPGGHFYLSASRPRWSG